MAYVSFSGKMKSGKSTWRSSTPSKSLVLRAKNGYVPRKLKKMAYISFSGEMKCGKSMWRSSTPSKSLVLRAKNGYLARKLKRSTWRSSAPSKSLVLRAKNGYVARKLKSINMVIIYPFKIAGFKSEERQRSSEIKERQRGDHQPLQSRWF